jgi:hypothetical protein
MSRIVIPGVVDVLPVDGAAMIAAIAGDRRFDRQYVPRGPLVNRIILGRVRSILTLGGVPLPPVAEHGSVRPVPSQRATQARLDALAAAGLAGPAIDTLAAYVRGEGRAERGGMLAQQAVGQLFDLNYRADAESWSAALVLRDAPSSFNPVKRLLWALTGRIAKARALLAEKVNQDPTGLHGTGVAIHNLAEAFMRMRALYADPAARGQRSVAAAVAAAMVAPTQVLRQPTVAGTCPAGPFTENTLVLLQLEKANARMPGYDTAFMAGSWSACPAQGWVPALLAAVWRGAIGGPAK